MRACEPPRLTSFSMGDASSDATTMPALPVSPVSEVMLTGLVVSRWWVEGAGWDREEVEAGSKREAAPSKLS